MERVSDRLGGGLVCHDCLVVAALDCQPTAAFEANCYGCGFHYHSPFKENILFIMSSHTYNCEGAKRQMLEFFTDETVGWKFKGYNWYFRYTPGQQIVYVFVSKEAKNAMCGLPLETDEPTKEFAQKFTHEWIEVHDKNYYFPTVAGRGPTVIAGRTFDNPPQPDDDYEGPQCDMCGDRDEDVLIPSPADMIKHRCVECFVGSQRA